jgi:hypothetical protein
LVLFCFTFALLKRPIVISTEVPTCRDEAEKSIQKQTCPDRPVVSEVEPSRGISRLAYGSLKMTSKLFSARHFTLYIGKSPDL